MILTQSLPFVDPRAIKLYGQFESGVYKVLAQPERRGPRSIGHRACSTAGAVAVVSPNGWGGASERRFARR